MRARGIREVPKTFKDGNNSHAAWALRTQAGQAMEYMAPALGSMGPEKVYSLFSKWTDRIAAGELPFDKPERPLAKQSIARRTRLWTASLTGRRRADGSQ